jgi:hypothetical protein
MKKIMINNESDLLSFLKVVAKESVNKSLRETNDLDRNVELYNQQKNKDSKIFNSLKEEDEEEAQPDAIDADAQPEDRSEDLPDKDVETEITPRKIISQINNIRAGHSLKNSDVKENLLSFLERLDDNEVLVLFYYLDGIAKILNQTIKGSEAIDPSEDPLNIKMNRSGEEKQSIQKVPKTTEKPKGAEDTSPPIKVNENQCKEDIRRKIRILMS